MCLVNVLWGFSCQGGCERAENTSETNRPSNGLKLGRCIAHVRQRHGIRTHFFVAFYLLGCLGIRPVFGFFSTLESGDVDTLSWFWQPVLRGMQLCIARFTCACCVRLTSKTSRSVSQNMMPGRWRHLQHAYHADLVHVYIILARQIAQISDCVEDLALVRTSSSPRT